MLVKIKCRLIMSSTWLLSLLQLFLLSLVLLLILLIQLLQLSSLLSLWITEKLIKEITTVTDSYKLLQDKETRLASDLTLAQAQLFPLRRENARLG